MTDAMRDPGILKGNGVPRLAKARTVSHFMKPTVAVELLRAQHGDENALKIALQEQQRARRARSRRRFEFWAEVSTIIGRGRAGHGQAVSGSGDSDSSESGSIILAGVDI
jgi:hypothetical protein